MILNISPSFLDEAAEIYSISWITSHKDVCSDSFLIEHTPSFMKRKIEREIESGWEYYISLSPSPSGIVGIKGNEISSLYRKTAVKLPPFKEEDVRLKNECLNCHKSL
ncbi:MAG: hypothetical protein ACI4NB_01130 [Candidatus Ornithospirochaeta sp.]